MSLDNSPSPVEEGDIIYDIDNERTYIVERRGVRVGPLTSNAQNTRTWWLFCLNEGWSDIFGEESINRNFEQGFWRLQNTVAYLT